MQRRRFITSPTIVPVQWSSGHVKRHIHDAGGLGKISYTPPGNSVPRLPWFRGANTARIATPVPLPPSMTTVKASAPPLVMPSSAELDGILNVAMMEGDASAATGTTRAMAESVGVLQSTAAQSGPMRATATRRMPVLTGPTLDTRIGDIIKPDESVAADMLPDIVRLLIDPAAEGVENVSLSDFASMQPKRQLAALNGKRSWHEWLLESPHYKQVSRLSMESPHYDLRALRLAGITTLYQWAEQPNLVKVSSYTRSLLDAAVEKSVEAYVDEVVKLVNTSNNLEDTLAQWAADIIGKFVLDSLNIPVNHAMMQSGGIGFNGASTGQVCTLDHYYRLVRKVLASVRREYMMQRQMGPIDNEATKASLDPHAEAEIREKAYATLSDAMLRVLEAQAPTMPVQLHPLRDYGFLALERLPGLLRQTASVLQLQSVPVRYFVFHNTGEWCVNPARAINTEAFPSHPLGTKLPGAQSDGNSLVMGGCSPSSLEVAAPTMAGGVFLTGSTNYNVTLGEWCGSPQPPSSPELWRGNPVQNEYFSVLHRLKRHTIRVARTTLFDAIKDANRLGKGFNASEALGLEQLFGAGKLVEDRLLSVLSGYYTSSASSKQLHFVEAGHSCGKTSVIERLSKRMAESGRTAIIVRYSGSTTPFAPGLDDHPLAFASRFWFRVALASCPYLVRTEEIFTRAPQSVMWWAKRNNWSWELYQKRIRIRGHCEGAPPPLHAILVDDIDRVLDSMELNLLQETYPGVVLNKMDPSGLLQLAARTREPGIVSSEAQQHQLPSNVGKSDDSDLRPMGTPPPITLGSVHTQHGQEFTSDMVEAALLKVTVALGQLNMVFTGHHVSKVLLVHADAPVRRYFVPLTSGIGLQQRLRVLPLVSVLYALHQRFRLGFSGLMYEVLKNCPGLLGYTLDVFWSGRAALMDLRGGAPRLMQWSGTHPLLRSYVPNELFADLPQRNYLLRNPTEARMRLVELLQRQLSSPTGFLTRDVDTVRQDERDGLIVPYNHTACQVHPFALFTIFSHQDPLESPRETPIVRAWGEVWAEYCAVVSSMGTTSARKRDALRVLLHGALLLRAVAVSGVQIDLNLKIPPYGFPLLASPTRSKQRGGNAPPVILKPTTESVRKAATAYRAFFANTPLERFPFRPSVGLNGGCDVVFVDGTTLALYDLVTTAEALRYISYRFAEALIGVLHCIEKNVLPQNRIQTIHYVSVVSVDQTSSVNGGCGANRGQASILATEEMVTATPVPIIPYFLDLSAVFEDGVIDQLRALQDILGINKEFRTLNDILDELESVYHVRVHQDVVASHAELESLLSSTLMQLVPDATVLPPYRSEVLPPDALMVDILEDEDNAPAPHHAEAVHSNVAVSNEVHGGECFTDGDLAQDSAVLLEAMMSDDLMSGTPSHVVEPISNTLTTLSPVEGSASGETSSVGALTPDSPSSPVATASQEDALAWLHDLVTPAVAAGQEADRSVGSSPVPLYSSGTPHRPAVITATLPQNRKANALTTNDAVRNMTSTGPEERTVEAKKGQTEGEEQEVDEIEETEVEELDVGKGAAVEEQVAVEGRGRGRGRGRKKESDKNSSGRRGRKPLQPLRSHEKKSQQLLQRDAKKGARSTTTKKASIYDSIIEASILRAKRKVKEVAKPAKRPAPRVSAVVAPKTKKNTKKR